MSGIKGVGTGVVEAILQERKRNGPFKNLYDFTKRIDTKRVGKKVIEELADAGCFDFTGWSRDALRQSVDPMYEAAVREQKETSAGIMNLFSLMGDTTESRFANPPPIKSPRTKLEILLKEKELMGFFLTGHPLDNYREILKKLSCVPINMIEEVSKEAVYRCAFIVETAQVRTSAKTQKKFAILTISNGIDRYELPIWSDLYEEKSQLLKENQLLYAVLHVEKNDAEMRLSCKWLDDLSRANESMIEACDAAFDKAKHQAAKFAHIKSQAKNNGTNSKGAPPPVKKEIKAEVVNKATEPFLIKIDAASVKLSHILELKKVFEKHRGKTPVQMDFIDNGHSIAVVHVDSAWGITLTQELQQDLKQVQVIKG
jgi:DNA polymerase-3 subunit alpha